MTNAQKVRTQYYPKDKQKEKTAANIIKVNTIDYSIFFVTILLVLIGVVMVFSASSSGIETGGDIFSYLKSQSFYALIGLGGMIFMAYLNYRYLIRIAPLAYVVSNILLLVVFFTGEERGGARRWIDIGGISVQPSELAKIGLILMISLIISSNKDILKKWSGLFVCCAVVGVTTILAFLGSMSSAIIMAVIGFGIIFIASPHTLRFIIAGIGGVSSVVAYLVYAAANTGSFRGGRLMAWLDPFADPTGKGYQTVQSLYAIASGGWFGLGLGQSRQKTFIPEAHNDIIFSIVCEELGLAGAAIVILLFSILIWRGFKVAMNAPDTFGSLTAAGIVVTIAAQVIINIAVVTNTIPNTGVSLPFISSGGTALVVMMGMVGILLNISRYSRDV